MDSDHRPSTVFFLFPFSVFLLHFGYDAGSDHDEMSSRGVAYFDDAAATTRSGKRSV